MPAIERESDKDSGGNTIIPPSGNPDVFADNLLIARLGDQLTDTDIDSDPSTIVITEGSPTIFVHNLPVARQGDATNDTSEHPPAVLIGGSSTVFADS